MKGEFSASSEVVQNIVDQLSGIKNAQFTFISKLKNLTEFHISALKSYTDEKYMQQLNRGKTDIEDFKINLKRNELKTLIGEKSTNELEALFSDSYDEIIIRRC